MAARQLKRPVKTALTRQQMFHVTTHRSRHGAALRLGADARRQAAAIGHEALSHSARFDDYYETASTQTRSLYAAPNRMTTHRSVKLDLPVSDSCRAPGEAVGMLGARMRDGRTRAKRWASTRSSCASRNEPKQDPEKNVPYSTRQLVRCLHEGAERFGWDRRNPQPGLRCARAAG
jgi:xanthine dehydrogenase YagR molybdenum-binding subunit